MDVSDIESFRSLFDFPKLRENLWSIQLDEPYSFVETTDRTYEVPTEQALAFLKIRTHCTGHNSVAEIERRSGASSNTVVSILAALTNANILLPKDAALDSAIFEQEEMRGKLVRIGEMWAQELSRAYVANELLEGGLHRSVLLGWLVETYHYVRDFPEAIACGAARAQGELSEVLHRYVAEERGHESFVLQTLVNAGFTEKEICASSPLVSTRLIGLLLRELFEFEPMSVLLVASMIEAQDSPQSDIEKLQYRLEQRYGFPSGTMSPYFQHQQIDASLGHSKMLSANLHLLTIENTETLNNIVHKLHDIKHAFELQSAEIKSYYGELAGKYFPRQPMTFAAL